MPTVLKPPKNATTSKLLKFLDISSFYYYVPPFSYKTPQSSVSVNTFKPFLNVFSFYSPVTIDLPEN